MESLETILLLLGCVMVSSVFDQVLPRVSIPLVQIALGAAVGVLVADEATVIFSDPEFFMIIFIAPLLFDEARHADKQALWENKGAVLSLAIGLVLVTTLVVGFVLHLIVPSVSLAAAFALGAALGPTDAVAVAALGKEVSLTKRQSAYLKGEALINDASGVVCFEFAIAAAVTGAFSAAEAIGAFVVEFFGGIALGLVLGAVIMFVLRRVLAVGLESPTVYVLLEVCTPFFAYLLSEQVGVSGVLAVVAAGLFMKFYPSSLTIESSRYAVASENVWELVVYVVNGVVFVLLGMKLPEIIMPTWNEAGAGGAGIWLLGLILLITVVVEGVRLVWCVGMEMTSARSWRITAGMVRSAAVTTLSGPKGAVTLSIVLSIPYYAAGAAFPNRDLLIFLASGVIVCTLLLANFVVPLLAPGEETSESAEARSNAEVEILQNVILQLEEQKTPENEMATIAVIDSYRNRIQIAREDNGVDPRLYKLRLATLRDQLSYVRERIRSGEVDRSAGELYAGTLSRRITSMERGATGKDAPTAQAQKKTPFSWGVRALAYRAAGRSMSEKEKRELNALIRDAEHHAMAYLDGIAADADEEGQRIVALLKIEYTASYSVVDEVAARAGAVPTHVMGAGGAGDASVTRKFKLSVGDALDSRSRAKAKSRAVEAKALGLELEQIQQMREAGRITPAEARELRNEVYVLQMGLEAR